jgi:hypothetical protein
MSSAPTSMVQVFFRDVQEQLITDQVKIKLYNQKGSTLPSSLHRSFDVKLKGDTKKLADVPANQFGVFEVVIQGTKYRAKSKLFINVHSGENNPLKQSFFLNASKVKPVFDTFQNIKTKPAWSDLWRVLHKSGVTKADDWKAKSDLLKAGLFNLHAKMQQETLSDNSRIFSHIDRIIEFRQERIYAVVDPSLVTLVRGESGKFKPAPSTMHEFPSGWHSIEESYKLDNWKAGNLQLTFAQNSSGAYMADLDIDDHKGLEHVWDVLKHKLTGEETHPYDIHQILIYFQNQLDPGYKLV